MTYENERFVEVVRKVINTNWDKIVLGKMTETDKKNIGKRLYDETNNYEWSVSIAEFICRKSSNNNDIPAEIKAVLTDAMIDEFLHEEHSIQDWTLLILYWDIFKSFRDKIKETLKTDGTICIEAIRRVSINVFSNPECLVYGYEKERFKSSVRQWDEEKDLIEFWTWGGRDFFPYDADVFLIPYMLLPEEKEVFLEIASHLTYPPFLYELIAGVHIKGDAMEVIDLLSLADSCIDPSTMQWNKSWVAPVLMDEVFQKVLSNFQPGKKNDDEEIRIIGRVFDELGKVLNNRNDGIFLAWNYTKLLSLEKRKNHVVYKIGLERVSEILQKKSLERFPSSLSLTELFVGDIEAMRKTFCETGILLNNENDSAFVELSTWIRFFFCKKKYLIESLPYIELSLMCSDDDIKAYEVKLQQCHRDIAQIYLDVFANCPVQGWKKTWDMFVMARYRIKFNYYDEFSRQIKNRLNFLLLVAGAMLDLLIKGNSLEKANELWNYLMEIMESYMQNKFSHDEEFTKNYARALFIWRYRLLEEQYKSNENSNECINNDMSKYLQNIETYPEIYNRVIERLKTHKVARC